MDLEKYSYVNSDYGISSAMKGMKNLQEIILSYDIACQYSHRFLERFMASPYLQLPACPISFAIPKFHLPAHKDGCCYFYSFNYMKKVGRTDGEAIERFWSRHNYLSGSTSRMTPEGRLDALNTHFADWNWRKLCNMSRFSAQILFVTLTIIAQEKRFELGFTMPRHS
jgi:hypothetical protein